MKPKLGDAHATRRNRQFAVSLLNDASGLVGSCGIRMEGSAAGEAVFGVEPARPYWGRYRYAQDVSEALISWAFDQEEAPGA
jgi:RimJ/RimL family protein N-acetyltransferase